MIFRRSIGLVLGLCVVFSSVSLAAAEIGVQAYVQPASSITDVTKVRLVIEITGEPNPQVDSLQLGELKNLRLLTNRPEVQRSSSFVNGKSSSSYRLVYTLIPDAVGTASIAPIAVGINGKTFQTNPVRFEVQASPKRPDGPGASTDGSFSSGNVVFAETVLSAQEVWVGEPLMSTATVYSSVPVSNLGLGEMPSFTQFLATPVDVDVMAEARQVVLDGRNYAVYPVRRHLLIALSPGEYEIAPYMVEVVVRSRRDTFDLFSRGSSVLRTTAPKTVRVKALPSNAPAGFGGAVGDFRFRATLDRADAAVNDAVALRVEVEGRGSLQAIDAPLWTAPEGLKVYDPESKLTTDIRDGALVSRKSWEWIVIPLAPGELLLDDIGFAFFDPRSGKYVTATAPALSLNVVEGDSLPVAGPTPNRGVISLDQRDIDFIQSSSGRPLALAQPLLQQRGWFMSLVLAPVFWVPFLIWLGRRRDLLLRDQGIARARRARKRARKALAAAKKQMGDGDGSSFHEEIARALVTYVGDRFNRAPSGLTYELADELLAERGVDESVRARFRACLETCDFARFVPASGETGRRNEVLLEAIALVDALERAC